MLYMPWQKGNIPHTPPMRQPCKKNPLDRRKHKY